MDDGAMKPIFGERMFYGRHDFGGFSMDVEVFYPCLITRSAAEEPLDALASKEAMAILAKPVDSFVSIDDFGTLVRAIGDHPSDGRTHPIRIQGAAYDADLVVACLKRAHAAGRSHIGTCAVEAAAVKTKKASRLLQIRGFGWRVYVMPLNPDSDYARAREAV